MGSTRADSTDNAPLQIVILGGTGDLAKRKLIPALIDLYSKKKLPKRFVIVGQSRKTFSDADYEQFVQEALEAHKHSHTKKEIRDFCARLQYVEGSFKDQDTFKRLKARLKQNDAKFRQQTNRMYYLAVPPEYYEVIFDKLHANKLHRPKGAKQWARILVEKPFGKDYESARKLDRKLGKLFNEEQIYRIDHYLAKEAVQNMLSFRFANTLIKSAWNNAHIEKVSICMHETADVSGRGSFYDSIGALRDVGQNHLLQLFALLTMEEPERFTANAIREKRAAALSSLAKHSKASIKSDLVRGQYAGYRKTEGVAKDSETETFFALRTMSNHPDWKGVPFFISAGKALDESKVEVTIHFKDVTRGMFDTASCETVANRVVLTISPEQMIHVTLNIKAHGLGYQLENRLLSFDCTPNGSGVQNSYQKVLLDCIAGDQTLFTSTAEVLESWKYISSVMRHMDEVPLVSYAKKSRGPKVDFKSDN